VWYASQPYSTLAEAPLTAARNTMELASALSWPLLPLVLAGCWAKILKARHAPDSGTWAALLALSATVWLFHSVLYPAFDLRYLLPAFPPIVLFACAGLDAILKRWPRAYALRLAALSVLIVAYLITTFDPPQKENRGFDAVAETLISGGLSPNSTLLVSSDGDGE